MPLAYQSAPAPAPLSFAHVLLIRAESQGALIADCSQSVCLVLQVLLSRDPGVWAEVGKEVLSFIWYLLFSNHCANNLMGLDVYFNFTDEQAAAQKFNQLAQSHTKQKTKQVGLKPYSKALRLFITTFCLYPLQSSGIKT